MTASGSVSVPRSPAQGRVVNSKEEITIAAAEDGLARLETAAADLPHGHRHAENRRLERHGQVSPIIAAARGHFPTEQAAMKCLYLAIMSLDPTGKGRKRWTNRWKAALNAFDITFDGRLSAGRK